MQEKLNGSVVKQWIWAGGPQPAEERDATNAVTKRFYGGLGQQIGTASYYFTTDHLGSVREMTDTTGAVRARYDYDPYGRTTKVSGDLEADFGFTGFHRHTASGLSLTLYRAYDTETGRWLSRDPIAESGGINLYRYVANNPVNAIDPLGLLDSTSKTLVGAGSAVVSVKVIAGASVTVGGVVAVGAFAAIAVFYDIKIVYDIFRAERISSEAERNVRNRLRNAPNSPKITPYPDEEHYQQWQQEVADCYRRGGPGLFECLERAREKYIKNKPPRCDPPQTL